MAAGVRAEAKVAVSSEATESSVVKHRALKAVAMTDPVQKVVLTTEATTARHAKMHRAVTVAPVAMAMSCPVTSIR